VRERKRNENDGGIWRHLAYDAFLDRT